MKTYLSPIDAVALAIFHYEGQRPGNRNYRNNNPGNLRDSSVPHSMDPDGYCIFASFVAGFTAAAEDLRAKFRGTNSHGLGPSSTLLDLFRVYAPSGDNNAPDTYAEFVAGWLSEAYGKPLTVMATLGDVMNLGMMVQ